MFLAVALTALLKHRSMLRLSHTLTFRVETAIGSSLKKPSRVVFSSMPLAMKGRAGRGGLLRKKAMKAANSVPSMSAEENSGLLWK